MPVERLAQYIKSLEEHEADAPHTNPPDFSDTQLLNIGNRQTSLPRTILVQFGIGSPSVDGRGITRYSRGFIQSDVQSLQSAVQIGPGSFAQTPESSAYGSYSTALDRGGIAFGLFARATLPDAIAIGEQSDVRGAYAIGLGTRCLVTAPYAILIGIQSQNSGQKAISIGYQSNVSGLQAIGIGVLSTVSAAGGTAIGPLTTIHSAHSLALGDSASDSAVSPSGVNISIGYLALSNNGGIAIGQSANASVHNNTMALGNAATPTLDNQFAIGTVAFPLDPFIEVSPNGQTIENQDSNATSIPTVSIIQHEAIIGTTPAAGFGVSWAGALGNSSRIIKTASKIQVLWTTATAGSEAADWVVLLMSGGIAAAEQFRVSSAGDAKAQRDLIALRNLVLTNASQPGTITSVLTAGRTWTMPDATGNITYETAALTNNNFLFGGGGALVKDSTFSVVPIANGGTAGTTAATARANLAAAQNNGGSVAAGTYTVGAKLTMAGVNGTITINADGVITAIQQAT